MFRGIGILVVLMCTSLMAQNAPTIGAMPNDSIIVGSGQNYLIVPGIDDGESGSDQTISVAAVSSNNAVLEVENVDYVSGDKTAIIRVLEKGTEGDVTVTVTVTDPDGSTDGVMNVNIGPINNPGIKFEVHDIVFWQEAVPLTTTPVYSRVLPVARIQNGDLDFSEIPITVNMDCITKPPCTGEDFYTQMYKGYLTVPTTGAYTFYVEGNNRKGLWLSSNDDMASAVPIIADSEKRTVIGTDVGNNQWQSAPQTLTAGTVYALYATHYVVHNHPSGILFEGPGITKQYIPGDYLMPTYSLEKPGAPEQLSVVARGTNFLRIAWNPSSTSGAAKTYHVYVDGTEMVAVTDTAVTIDGLSLNTTYSVFVVGEDNLGKMSFPSNIVTVSTHSTDGTPPTAPTSVTADTVSDLALLIRWSGATDGESEVVSYNVYVDGALHNQQPLYQSEITLRNLTPSTAYSIEVEAVDAGGNVSPKSSPLSVTTLSFDPNNPELGVKKAAISFTSTAVANACGLGINADYKSGDVFTANIRGLLDELHPNLLRWGALTANPLNFADYSGAGKQVTYAKFLDLCNSYNAYCAITTGVKDGTDWRNNMQTFVNFIEYLNGPSTSTYGAIRAAEGFTEPLMANSKGLLIELGNEVWGGAAHNAEIGEDYRAYGAWCRQVAELMKASPYWDSDKMWVVISGRNPHPQDSYGLNFNMMMNSSNQVVDTGQTDMVALGGYLGGNLNYDPEIAPGKSEGEYYKDGFKRMQRNIDGLDIHIDWYTTNTGGHKPSFFYETNMTTTSYNGRLGQAVTEIDYMATAIEHGSVVPGIFHLTGGQWKIVRESEDNFKLPLFVGASYYNRLCQGHALGGWIETQGTLTDANGRTFDMEPVGYHLYNNGSSFTVLLTSRDFENDYTVQLNLPGEINAGSSAKRYVLSGTDFSTITTVIDSANITLSNGMLVTVPKHSMVFITFSGTGVSADLPLGYFTDGVSVRQGPAQKLGPALERRMVVPCEIYDLLGRRITVTDPRGVRALNLPSGVYLSKQAREVRKLHESLLKR